MVLPGVVLQPSLPILFYFFPLRAAITIKIIPYIYIVLVRNKRLLICNFNNCKIVMYIWETEWNISEFLVVAWSFPDPPGERSLGLAVPDYIEDLQSIEFRFVSSYSLSQAGSTQFENLVPDTLWNREEKTTQTPPPGSNYLSLNIISIECKYQWHLQLYQFIAVIPDIFYFNSWSVII